MTISLIFVIKVLEAINAVMENVTSPLLRFNLKKIGAVLEQSIDIASPLVSENNDENQWLISATTLPFQPVKKQELIDGISKSSIDTLRWLLMITKD